MIQGPNLNLQTYFKIYGYRLPGFMYLLETWGFRLPDLYQFFSFAHISGTLQTDTMICQANSNHFNQFLSLY